MKIINPPAGCSVSKEAPWISLTPHPGPLPVEGRGGTRRLSFGMRRRLPFSLSPHGERAGVRGETEKGRPAHPTRRSFTTLVLFFSFATLAHATSPKFNSTTPSGGQRGTELDLRCNGARLEDAQEIIFYSPGIQVLKIDPVKANSPLKARIRIAKDCALGEHLLRIRTASGISDVRTFWVGPFKTIEETEPNNELAKAQPIPLNVTVSGTIASEDVDYFRIDAKRGQRISAEIEAIRLGRGAFDPYLAIHECSGEVLAHADDTTLLMQDGFISMLAPKDGSYIIQVRETSYGGRPEFAYRLHVGMFPRPTAVYPPGGQAGVRSSSRPTA